MINLDACITDPEIEDEYVTKTVFSIMNILVIIWLENFIKAAINSDVGMIWSGWKNILENIKNIQKHLSLFYFIKSLKLLKSRKTDIMKYKYAKQKKTGVFNYASI